MQDKLFIFFILFKKKTEPSTIYAVDSSDHPTGCTGYLSLQVIRPFVRSYGDKHVLVNGKCVNIPSYTVKPGDKIEIKEKVKGYQRYKDVLETTEGRLIPDWLEADHETLTGTVKEIPTREQIDVPVNEVLIVELYSK